MRFRRRGSFRRGRRSFGRRGRVGRRLRRPKGRIRIGYRY